MTQVVESVSVEVAGAQVTIPKETVVKAWLANVMAAAAPAAALPETLTLGDLRPGELYAGLILGNDGEPGHHLILLPGDAEDKTWEQAKEWAGSVGGELPTRREQSLLFANLGDEFESAWYWSGTPAESHSYLAWVQSFGNGVQNYYHKNYEFRARAVRRLPL
ncbi:DUF1566 domain-containing protein [Cupriavidus campinensis]|uniref:DUF1566 domain-containing protein n=1 Tax=Cupriavidus campinensis TaxID=151783 RepID=A0AAE9HYQ8_9BURK|nr:DUF1566 domain-containing protein [Cupriavidus campinensis]URF02827.1 DUF1566 domain-containing protein [Cupriavidus campinensis]